MCYYVFGLFLFSLRSLRDKFHLKNSEYSSLVHDSSSVINASCPVMFSVKKEVIEVYIKFFFTSVCMASLQVQMLFNNEFLPDHMTMKRLWLSHWFGKVQCTHCQLAQINATHFFTPEQFLCTRIQLVNKEKVLRCIIKNSSHSLKNNC